MGALANTTPPPLCEEVGEHPFLLFLRALRGRVLRPFGQFPDQNPFAEESLASFHDRMWDDLDPEIQRCAVQHLRSIVSIEVAQEARAAMEADPEEWMIEHHHFWGQWIRNQLRDVVLDVDLPSGNWDDYYVRAFEEAIGGAED